MDKCYKCGGEIPKEWQDIRGSLCVGCRFGHEFDPQAILVIPNENFIAHNEDGSRVSIKNVTFDVPLNHIIRYYHNRTLVYVDRNFATLNNLSDLIHEPTEPIVSLEKICLGMDITEVELEELYDWHEIFAPFDFFEYLIQIGKKIKRSRDISGDVKEAIRLLREVSELLKKEHEPNTKNTNQQREGAVSSEIFKDNSGKRGGESD